MIVSLKKTAEKQLIGTKALNLAVLSQKYPVPPGFVLTSDTFQNFLETSGVGKKANQLLKTISQENCAEISNTIQMWIKESSLAGHIVEELHDAYYALNIDETHSLQQMMDASHDPLVIVRPSPMHTEKNVHVAVAGIEGIEQLKTAILECWASFYSEDALAQNLHTTPHFAVIVQKMIESTASGVLHTSYKMNSGEVLIYGCKGLGTVLSTGLIVPDKYFITKHSLNIASIELGKQLFMVEHDAETKKIAKVYLQEEYSKKQKISDKHIGELTLYSKEIEEMFGKQMEVEFAIHKDALYFVNAQEAELHVHEEKKQEPVQEQTYEEMEKKEQEISQVLTEELENDVLVVNALNPQEENIVSPQEPVYEQPHSIVADPNDINAVIMGIDFNKLVQETEAIQQHPSEPAHSYVFAEEQKQAEHITEKIVQEEQEQVDIEEVSEVNKKELTAFEKTAGELIIHCFKEIKSTLSQDQWSNSPELRHIAVLAHNYSQKKVAPTPAQIKFAMDAVEKVKK